MFSGGADDLFGGEGADGLRGAGRNDALDGGEGADRLHGGDGADSFAFATSSGDDLVRDFEVGIDRFQAAALVDWTAAQEAMTDTEDGVPLSFGGEDQVLLQGGAIDDLDAGSFLFG